MDNFKHLLDLVKNNPELPVIPMVDSDVCDDRKYWQYRANWGNAAVDEYIIVDGFIFFKSGNDIVDVLEQCLTENEFYELPDTDEAFMAAYDALPWIKAIIVYIEP